MIDERKPNIPYLSSSEAELLMEVLPNINHMRDKVWYRVKDESAFGYACFTGLVRSFKNYDESKGPITKLGWYIIKANLKRHTDWRTRLEVESLEFLQETNEDKSNKLKDVLADVEEVVLFKEKIAFLAEGDSRKEVILRAWSEGFENESELAALLAQRFGGNAESQRKFIRRFRKSCRKRLLVAA
ncbi:hypothetical protein [Paenibacillus dendritiformis]|uniref:hypothetical protein n=1 Tax=Paenibacillus dendritiformis TaxID=130049 RepID=UPI00387E0EF7